MLFNFFIIFVVNTREYPYYIRIPDGYKYGYVTNIYPANKYGETTTCILPIHKHP